MSTLDRRLPLATAFAPSASPDRSRRTPPATGRMLLAFLRRLERGAIVVETPDGSTTRFGANDGEAPVLSIRDWRIARDTLQRGDVGFAEGYIAGHWDTPDLVGVLTRLAENQPALERAFYGRRAATWLLRLRHWLNANTRRQARRNIVAHYDLGNDFYRLWLDETMTYSSACFDGDRSRPLAAAQLAKYERILAELALPPGAHILEIGCGWGGFAEVAARAGYRVTGLSLSDAQTDWARERLARAGLADRVDFRIEDYRDHRGRYAGVASIEMYEAVGERWWPAYFAKIRDVLAPGGRACVQGITIAESRFERYRRETDFIQQHVFPGGMLASPTRLVAEAKAAGLAPVRQHRFGRDYAETLTRWLAAFDANTAAVRAQGFDERFVRCWRFYLAYCVAGFLTESTDVGHYTFARP
jgi:cyclopropane-fatty-acyl-phospholipid synthase